MADDRTEPQYKLRMSEEMHARLKAEAEANKRSMNAEIIARLERTLADSPQAEAEDVAFIFQTHDELAELKSKYADLQKSFSKYLEMMSLPLLRPDGPQDTIAREAASNAMAVALHGYVHAVRALNEGKIDEATISLSSVIDDLDRAMDTEDTYKQLQRLRNRAVHRIPHGHDPSDSEGTGGKKMVKITITRRQGEK